MPFQFCNGRSIATTRCPLYLQQTVLASADASSVESSHPQIPSKAMANSVPFVFEGDGIIAQSNPVAVFPQSVP